MRTRRSRFGVSSDLQGQTHGIWRKSATDLSLTILKQKLNRCLQILLGFLDGFTLSVRETLENPSHPRENAPVIAGADWVHGQQAARIWRLRAGHG
jgi:hypothetical protein